MSRRPPPDPRVDASWQMPPADTHPELRYAAGVYAYLSGDFRDSLDAFTEALRSGFGRPSGQLLGATAALQLGRTDQALSLLERVVASDTPLPDELMRRYSPPSRVSITIELAVTEGVPATIQLDTVGAALILAELYQERGRRQDALRLVGALIALEPANETIRLSLCDLQNEDADFEGVKVTASGTSPETDIGLACHVFKAQAEGHLGDWQASRATVEVALSVTSASGSFLLTVAHNVLGIAYDSLGMKDRGDAERKLAERVSRVPSRKTKKPLRDVYQQGKQVE